jgi:hypothetical protein
MNAEAGGDSGKRPKSELGGFNWEIFPDEVFTQTKELKEKIVSDIRLQEALRLLEEYRRNSNLEAIAYAAASQAGQNKRREQGALHPDLTAIAEYADLAAAWMKKAEAPYERNREVLAEIKRKVEEDPEFEHLYSSLESQLERLIELCLQANPTAKTTDRGFFDKGVFLLLTKEPE